MRRPLSSENVMFVQGVFLLSSPAGDVFLRRIAEVTYSSSSHCRAAHDTVLPGDRSLKSTDSCRSKPTAELSTQMSIPTQFLLFDPMPIRA
jgi:hypothetical protein